jgi:hypothetical protein
MKPVIQYCDGSSIGGNQRRPVASSTFSVQPFFIDGWPGGYAMLLMILEMRKAESSTKLNSLQQAGRILLKRNVLKIGDFRKITTTALGAGGRAFKSPRPDQTVADSKIVI